MPRRPAGAAPNPPDEGGAAPDLETLRVALERAVLRHSLRAVARAVSMSPAGLKTVIHGARPRARTVRLLRRWYLAQSEEEQRSAEKTARAAVGLLTQGLPSHARPAAARAILRRVRVMHRRAKVAPPPWLGPLLRDPRFRARRDAGA
jgi:hypothetical protein